MTKFLFALLVIISSYQKASSQTTPPDALAANIPAANTHSVSALTTYISQNFSSDSSRLRAIYVWVATNVKYDVERLQRMHKEADAPPQAVADVLKTRSAVCQGYAELFVALCDGAGIKATMVGGYTKHGGVVSAIPHAWVAAQLAGNWYLFDPTWGAGYVKDNNFVKAFNDRFYKILPGEFIQDHMPFDPMYTFLNYTITNQDFIDGRTNSSTTKAQINYSDTLKTHSLLSPTDKMRSELRRLETAGIRNDLLLKRQHFLKKNLQGSASNDAFTEGGEAFKKATTLFNQYIGHKNQKFSTVDDQQLVAMIDSISFYTRQARLLLLEAVPKTDEQRQAKAANGSSIERFGVVVSKEKDFVTRYVAADKTARQQLHYSR